MKVRATQLGYFNYRRYKEGAIFDVPSGTLLGSWMEVVTKKKVEEDDEEEEIEEPSGRGRGRPKKTAAEKAVERATDSYLSEDGVI